MEGLVPWKLILFSDEVVLVLSGKFKERTEENAESSEVRKK